MLFFIACFFAVGYCNTDFCTIPGHLLCKVPFNNTGYCRGVQHRFIPENKADQNKILKYINDFRAKVASGKYKNNYMREKYPSASNMVELEWDEVCASAADTLANTCFGHSRYLKWPPCCRCTILSKFEVALFYAFDFIDSWEDSIDSALNENHHMNISFDLIRNYSESALAKTWTFGQYTFPIMARANMRYVGCSIHKYKSDGTRLNTDVICILGGVRDFYERPIYEEGTPCSNCPLGSRCSDTYPSLCKCQTDTCSVPPNPNAIGNYESPFCPKSDTKSEKKEETNATTDDSNKQSTLPSTTADTKSENKEETNATTDDSNKQSTLPSTTGEIGLEYTQKDFTITPAPAIIVKYVISHEKESHELDDGLAKKNKTGQRTSKKPPSKKKCKSREDESSAADEGKRIEKSLLWILVTLHTAILCSRFP